MGINPSEITTILKREIASFEGGVEVDSVGTVLSVGDGVARVYGLDDCMMSELLEFPNGVCGIALNLEEDNVGGVLLGDETKVKEGDTVKTTGRIISVPVGEGLLGRVVNALGEPVDGKGRDQGDEVRSDRAARAVRHRAPAGQGAAADRHQGHRRDDPDRPRTARADHRRPPDRQDRASWSTRSSTRRARTSSASTSRSARSSRP